MMTTPRYPPQRYDGATGQVSARVVPGGGAPDITFPNGNRMFVISRGSQTEGLYGLYRYEFAGPVSGAATHFHRTISESFFVLEGKLSIFDGLAWVTCGAGDYVHVPAGGLHGFRNDHGPAKMLLHFAPGAPREGYFEQLAAGIDGFTADQVDAFMQAHDNYWVAPA